MPLAGRYGDPDPSLTPEDLGMTVPQTVVSQQNTLDNQPYIKDTFVNRTAFNPTTYADDFKLLQRYISGSRITVTYFLISTPTGGLQRSEVIDPSSLRNPVQTSYTQINNFEIVIQEKGLQSSFDAEKMESKVVGVALLYPGMAPRMGDLFVTPIGDSKFGVFQIMAVDRLSYRQGSNHKITFFLREYATDEGIASIKLSVTKEVWFDKQTYLGDATTLLKADSYFYLKTLRQMRGILIRYYYNTFYDKSISSILSPDGIYDPYLVNYLNSKISIQDSIKRPTQLFPGLQNYENSLWSRLTEVTNRQLTNIQSNYNVIRYRFSFLDISITSVVNRLMIALENPNQVAIRETIQELIPPQRPIPFSIGGVGGRGARYYDVITDATGYVLSMNFYTGDKVAMTPFEFLVYAVIYERRVDDIADFIDSYVNTYAQLTYAEQYYFIPIYLWMMDVAIGTITAPNDFMT